MVADKKQLKQPSKIPRIIVLVVVCLMLFTFLMLLPVTIFGLSGDPDQNDAFFRTLALVFSGPISLSFFLSGLLSINKSEEQKKKMKRIRNYVVAIVIVINAAILFFSIWSSQQNSELRDRCISNGWYTTRWNYEECSKVVIGN